MDKETTNTQEKYEKLARQLDQFIVGVPFSPTLIEILKILFPEDELEMALEMSFENKTAAQLAGETGEVEETVRERLGRMAKRGTVYTEQRPGKDRTYRLLPSIIGFSETPFYAGKDTETTRALAPLWVKYLGEGFGGELERGMPLVRVIPIAESLKDASEILPFDAIKDKLEGIKFTAVAHCACRQMRRYVGEGCDHSLETCLHFEGMGRYMVEQGMRRQVDRDEVLKILEEATGEASSTCATTSTGVSAPSAAAAHAAAFSCKPRRLTGSTTSRAPIMSRRSRLRTVPVAAPARSAVRWEP
jgi:hypothetical protein